MRGKNYSITHGAGQIILPTSMAHTARETSLGSNRTFACSNVYNGVERKIT